MAPQVFRGCVMLYWQGKVFCNPTATTVKSQNATNHIVLGNNIILWSTAFMRQICFLLPGEWWYRCACMRVWANKQAFPIALRLSYWTEYSSTQDVWNPELSLANKSFFQSIKRRSQKTQNSRLGTLQIKSKSIPVFQTFTVLTRDLLCYCNNWGRMVQNVQILEKLGVHRSDLGDNKDALKINIGGFSSTLAPAWKIHTRA